MAQKASIEEAEAEALANASLEGDMDKARKVMAESKARYDEGEKEYHNLKERLEKTKSPT